MDIQLFATDKELKEFPENQTDPDTTSSPNSINLSISDLPRSHTELPKSQSGLPIKKLDIDAGLKEAADAKLNLTVKTL